MIAGDDPAHAAGLTQILAETAKNFLGMDVDLAASRALTTKIARRKQRRSSTGSTAAARAPSGRREVRSATSDRRHRPLSGNRPRAAGTQTTSRSSPTTWASATSAASSAPTPALDDTPIPQLVENDASHGCASSSTARPQTTSPPTTSSRNSETTLRPTTGACSPPQRSCGSTETTPPTRPTRPSPQRQSQRRGSPPSPGHHPAISDRCRPHSRLEQPHPATVPKRPRAPVVHGRSHDGRTRPSARPTQSDLPRPPTRSARHPQLHRTTRPRLSGATKPLEVTSTVRDDTYQQLLRASNPEATTATPSTPPATHSTSAAATNRPPKPGRSSSTLDNLTDRGLITWSANPPPSTSPPPNSRDARSPHARTSTAVTPAGRPAANACLLLLLLARARARTHAKQVTFRTIRSRPMRVHVATCPRTV